MAYSEFECDCGRIIKVKEILQQDMCKSKISAISDPIPPKKDTT
jgi:hypothetical protein